MSDRHAHLVKVFSCSDGSFLYEVGGGAVDVESNEPAGLTIDKAGHLLAYSGGNHSVRVFTLGGKSITMFGEYGNKLGQVNRPCSVSVLNSGRIVVDEFANHRLQIFK